MSQIVKLQQVKEEIVKNWQTVSLDKYMIMYDVRFFLFLVTNNYIAMSVVPEFNLNGTKYDQVFELFLLLFLTIVKIIVCI